MEPIDGQEWLENGWVREYYTDQDDGQTYTRVRRKVKPFTSEKTYAKVIRSGSVIEVYTYQKPAYLRRKMEGCGRKKKGDSGSDDRKKEYRIQSGFKARNMVRRLALSNFENDTAKFITLTFSDRAEVVYKSRDKRRDITVPKTAEFKYFDPSIDFKDVEKTNPEFKKFIQRMRRRYGKFKYLAVIEFQDQHDRGAVHYHMIADLPYIDVDYLATDLWGWGWCWITKIKHVDNVGAYVSKYMGKNMQDERLCGKKSYLTSSGLTKPEEYLSYDAYEKMSELKWEGQKPVYENKYGDEDSFVGEISYQEYNLKRKRPFRRMSGGSAKPNKKTN